VEELSSQVSSALQHVVPQVVSIAEHAWMWRLSKLIAYVWILQSGENNVH